MMLSVTFALLGVAIGSFLNLCVDRLPEGQSIWYPPSQCDACGQKLAFRDLIPILSYLQLGGKCRHCGSTIPLRNLWIEIGTGLLFWLIWLRFQASISTLVVALFSAILILILAIDLEHHRVLNRLTYPAIALALIIAPLALSYELMDLLLGGLLGFAILLLPAAVHPAGMGMGDVKLGAFIGLIVGYPGVLLALFLSFILGGLIAGFLFLTRSIGGRDPIAFAPFLSIGAITTLLYGDLILQWWLGRM